MTGSRGSDISCRMTILDKLIFFRGGWKVEEFNLACYEKDDRYQGNI